MKDNKRLVTISSRTIYHKFCTISLEIPSDIPLEETAEWLWNNEEKWVDELDQANSEAILDFGFGLGDGMDEQDNEHEVRYDVDGEKWGGHL